MEHHDQIAHALNDRVDSSYRDEMSASRIGARNVKYGTQDWKSAHVTETTNRKCMVGGLKESDVIRFRLKCTLQLGETAVEQKIVHRVVHLIQLVAP
jgi:hypothetical protein